MLGQKLAIFDVDGTLYDSEPSVARCNAFGFAAIGWHFPEGEDAADYILNELAGRGTDPKFQAVAAYLNKNPDPALYDAFKAATDRAALRAIEGGPAPMFARAKETLLHIKKDFTIAAATNNPSHLAYRVLSHEGLAHVFGQEHILAPDLMVPAQEAHLRYPQRKYQKPAPAMLLAHMRLNHAAPADTFMIGDTENDVKAARAAGVHAIGFMNAARPNAVNETKLREAGAHAFLRDWSPDSWERAVTEARQTASLRAFTPA